MFRILRSLENPSFHIQTRYGLFDEIEGEPGGGGGGGTGDDGGEDPKTGEEGKRKPGEAGDDPPKDGKWIPKHRFDEVNTGFGKYKELGSPEDIRKGLARLKELEALPQNRTTDKEKAEIRKELMSVLPEFQEMSSFMKLQRTNYTKMGASLNDGFLKEVGLQNNEKTNRYMQELLSGIIAEDRELLERFWGMDRDVFKDAFEIARKTFWSGVKRPPVPGATTQAKKTTSQAPAKQKSDDNGDGKGKKKDGEPLDRMGERDLLDKAGEDAFAMLEATRSE